MNISTVPQNSQPVTKRDDKKPKRTERDEELAGLLAYLRAMEAEGLPASSTDAVIGGAW